MSKVKCNHPKCRGTNHYPACAVYIQALEDWQPPKTLSKAKKNRGGHTKKGEGKTTPEERAEISRQNGKKGGRPPSPVPTAVLEILRKGKFRVRPEFKGDDEISEAAAELAGWSLERLAFAAAGRIHAKKAASAAKSAAMIREEICEPIVKETKVGVVDLGKALDALPLVKPEEKE